MKVKGYTRRDGVKVKGHNRKATVHKRKAGASHRRHKGGKGMANHGASLHRHRHPEKVRRGGKRVGVRTRRHRVHRITAG